MRYELITLVASSRGRPALRRLLSGLPSGFGTPIVCLVQADLRFAEDLQQFTRLKVAWAENGAALETGTVYLSRPGTSLVCRPDGTLSITPFGLESAALDPVDNFLASAAGCHEGRVLALVLAGFDQDGVAGARLVRERGGTVAILDRATAEHWGMAEPIVRAGACDRVLTVAEVAAALRACFTSRDLLHCAEIQIRLGEVLDGALQLAGAPMGHIARIESGPPALRIVVDRGLDMAFLERFHRIPPGGETACARTLLSRAREVIPDVMADERCSPIRGLAQACGIRAEHATPVFGPARDDLQGAVAALFGEPHHVSPEEERRMDALAARAATILAAFD